MDSIIKKGLFIFFWCILQMASGQNTKLISTSYVGGKGNDVAAGVGIIDQSVWLAGNFDDLYIDPVKYPNPPPQLFIGNHKDSITGKIIIISASTGRIEMTLNPGGHVTDFYSDRKLPERAYVSGTFGITCINTRTKEIIWNNSQLNDVKKIKVNLHGMIAALTSSSLYYIDGQAGNIISFTPLTYSGVTDIAIVNDKIFITGYEWLSNIDNKSYCNNYAADKPKFFQVAFLSSFIMSGGKYLTPLDTTWGYSNDQISCHLASTRGVKLCTGADGYLYFLGETTNSENIFKYNGKVAAGGDSIGIPSSATYIVADQYSDITSVSPYTPITYCAKVDPATGAVLQGQFYMGRTDSLINGYNNTGFEVFEGALDVDIYGYIYIGGKVHEGVPVRNVDFPNPSSVGTYAGGDPTLLINNPSWGRDAWRVFTGTNGKGSIVAIASNNGYTVAIGKVEKGDFASLNMEEHSWNPEEDQVFDVYVACFKNLNFPDITQIENNPGGKPVTAVESLFSRDFQQDMEVIELIDLQGKKLLQQRSLEFQELKNFPSGNYLVRMVYPDQVIVRKIHLE